MDPLHPFVPIQPPPPPRPTYGRVERIERDGQRESHPDWTRDSDKESDDEAPDQFEDAYDPDWTDPAAVEPYGPDGAQHDASINVELGSTEKWDPRKHGERRSRPRDRIDEGGPGDGHIDISA